MNLIRYILILHAHICISTTHKYTEKELEIIEYFLFSMLIVLMATIKQLWLSVLWSGLRLPIHKKKGRNIFSIYIFFLRVFNYIYTHDFRRKIYLNEGLKLRQIQGRVFTPNVIYYNTINVLYYHLKRVQKKLYSTLSSTEISYPLPGKSLS